MFSRETLKLPIPAIEVAPRHTPNNPKMFYVNKCKEIDVKTAYCLDRDV